MNKIEQIEFQINKKRERLGTSITIINPGGQVEPSVQAEWMISLLENTYHRHGISQNPDLVKAQIDSGNLRNWFALRDQIPVAVASLINQTDGSVEVGRAVSMDRGSGIGGLLMLEAAITHFKESKSPLIAEVRVSDEFNGIPSGEATQKISLGHIGLISHALVPAFHHGEPDRQEQFAFSTSEPIVIFEDPAIPTDKKSQDLIISSALLLAKSALNNENVVFKSPDTTRHGWIIDFTAPFAAISTDRGNTTLQKAVSEAEKHSPFTLIPLEMTPTKMRAIIECLNTGFIPCGIAREAGENGHPILLLGKLRKGTILAPIKLISNIFSQQQIKAIGIIDSGFRKNI